jgi:GTPase SAR1 family protein
VSVILFISRISLSHLITELKKNCPPDLIIYIVGSKADLHRHRQVTSDLARLSLHSWFPPPQLPVPAPPPPQSSTLSYIRPRFTSFTSNRSVPATPPHTNASESPLSVEPSTSRPSALNRSTPGLPQSKSTTGKGLARSKTTSYVSGGAPRPSHLRRRFGSQDTGWNEIEEASSDSLPEDDEDQEWGLHKGMELFEVSAKDDLGW